MASTKTFADMKKPARRPTPDEIAAFEETGKAARALDPALLTTETQKPVSPERNSGKGETPMLLGSQKSVSLESQTHTNTESSISVKAATQEHRSPLSRVPETHKHRSLQRRKPINTQTQKHGLPVQLRA